MFVTLTRVNTGDQPTSNATMVGEEMLRWLQDTEGFEGMLVVSREGSSLGFTFWRDRETAKRHEFARMQFRDRMMAAANVEVEETVDYDLTFAQLGSAVASFSA